MQSDEFNELAGRIEAMARVVLHLIARLEDDGVIDGPAMADGLRGSVVLNANSGALMRTAKRTLDEAANALDEARHWRRFRRQIVADRKRRSA